MRNNTDENSKETSKTSTKANAKGQSDQAKSPLARLKDPRWNRYDASRRHRRLIIWTKDNAKNLPPDYIPALASRFKSNIGLLKAHLYGEFCPLAGKIACPDFDPSVNVIDCPPDPYTPIIFSLDFNVEPLAWVALQLRTIGYDGYPKTHLCVVEEGSGKASFAVEAAVEFAHKFDNKKYFKTPIQIDGDSQGHRRNPLAEGTPFTIIKGVFRGHYDHVSIVANEYNPLEEDTLEVMNQAFSNRVLYIDRRCVNTINSCQAVQLVEGKRKILKSASDKVTHWFDGVKYPVFRLMQKLQIQQISKPRMIY